MSRPNFFIVGAPKCGTTALYEYLRKHPQVFMPQRKEPHFFADDIEQWPRIESLSRYLGLFEKASSAHAAVGEASVHYIYSQSAMRNIREFSADAKIIVLLRNPIDMVHAYYTQAVTNLDEDAPTFEDAWRLQNERMNGDRIPKTCRAPMFLQYETLGNYAEHLERIFSEIPREDIKIVLFDDFVRDTKSIYEDVVAFLGLVSDGRDEFLKTNVAYANRSRILARVTKRPPKVLSATVERFKALIGIDDLGIGSWMHSVNRLSMARKELSRSFRDELQAVFAPHIERLSSLIETDLTCWQTSN